MNMLGKVKELRAQKMLLTTIENKFLFVISRYFWHIITTISMLAILGGTLVFLYTLTPVFKSSPSKENYPEIEEVSKEELLSALAPKNKPQTKRQAVQKKLEETTLESTEILPIDSMDEDTKKYFIELNKLIELVPDVVSVQKNCIEQEYSYWYGNSCVRYKSDTLNRVVKTLDKLEINDYGSRTQLIEEYIKIVNNYEKKGRLNSLIAALGMETKDVSRLIADLNMLYKMDSVFKPNIKLLQKNANLLAKNPNDGKPLLQYIIQSAPSFSDSVWQAFALYMVDNYYGFKEFQILKERTDGFLPMAKGFMASRQLNALSKYYELQSNKNNAREQKIREIDRRFDIDLADAEMKYRSKKAAKSEMRKSVIIVIGSAIAVIAIFALILVNLSIQRNVVKLLERQEWLEKNLK